MLFDNPPDWSRNILSHTFNTATRDRPGGHVPSPIVMDGLRGYREYMKQTGRRFAKRQRARQARQVAKKIEREAIAQAADMTNAACQ